MRFNCTYLILVGFLMCATSYAQIYSASKIVSVPGIFGSTSVGDFDQDGDDDLLVSGYEFNVNRLRLYVIQNGVTTEKTNSGLPTEASNAQWIDYDGDLDLDVFVVNASTAGSKADFYINNSGTFSALHAKLPVLTTTSYSIVDFDKDGDIDVIMTGYEGANPSLLQKTYVLKNTNNTFSVVQTGLSGYPGSAGGYAWADFDKDNDLDVLISGSTSVSTLYINNGNNSFEIFSSSFPATPNGQVMWADFDKDGNMDLLLSGTIGSSVKILKNNGNKTFSEYPLPTIPGTILGNTQWIDYDKDGDLDLFNSGQSYDGNISQLYEFNNNTFTLVSDLGLPVTGNFAFIDYDLDQDLDIFISNDNFKSRIYRNNLKNNPYPLDTKPYVPRLLTAHSSSSSQVYLSWADYNNDELYFSIEMKNGTGDFAEITTTTNTNYTVTGLSAGIAYGFRVRTKNTAGFSDYTEVITMTSASPNYTRLTLTSTASVVASKWVDIDNDGDLDLVFSGSGTPSIQIMKNNAGNFVSQSHSLPNIRAFDFDWADFDHDGDLDLLVSGILTTDGTTKTKIIVNDGNFIFHEHAQNILGVRSGSSRWIDVNSDGYVDIFISGTVNNNGDVHGSQLLINNQNNTFMEKLNSGIPNFYQCDLEIGDFNDDGKADMVLSGFKDTVSFYSYVVTTELYLNQGKNEFKMASKFGSSGDGAIASADIDQDGDMDIIVSEVSGVAIYLNEKGVFSKDTRDKIQGPLSNLITGDIDSDGDMDIICAANSGTSEYHAAKSYFNDGHGLFTEGNLPFSQTDNYFSLGDFDQDGDLDIFNSGQNYTAFIKNNSPSINQKPNIPNITKAQAVPGGIVVEWTRGSDDKTPSVSLTSNIYLKNQAGEYLFNTHADRTSGKLKSSAFGNLSLNTRFVMNLLPLGTYEMGIQNIDNSFSASPFVTVQITITELTQQTITFNPVSNKQSSDLPFKISASASSGLPILFSSTSPNISLSADQVTIIKAGRAVVKANQTGNTLYGVAPTVDQSFCINPAKPVINVTTDPLVLTSNTTTGNQWYLNGAAIANATNNTLTTVEVGVYTVKVTVDDCVSDASDGTTIVITGEATTTPKELSYYPNPTDNALYIIGLPLNTRKGVVIDMTGRSYHVNLEKEGDIHVLHTAQFQPGLYRLFVSNQYSTKFMLFIKK